MSLPKDCSSQFKTYLTYISVLCRCFHTLCAIVRASNANLQLRLGLLGYIKRPKYKRKQIHFLLTSSVIIARWLLMMIDDIFCGVQSLGRALFILKDRKSQSRLYNFRLSQMVHLCDNRCQCLQVQTSFKTCKCSASKMCRVWPQHRPSCCTLSSEQIFARFPPKPWFEILSVSH